MKDYIHLYVVFCSRTGGMCSKSRYFNTNLNTKSHAIFKSAAIARQIRQSVDELTFCHTRGQNGVKTKTEVNTSNTLPQQMQRLRWTTLQELDAVSDEAILMGFPSRPVQQTPHNAFVGANAKVVDIDEELNVTIDYEKMVCSQGRLSISKVSVIADPDQHTLTFTHKTEKYGKRRLPTDQLYAVVLDKTAAETEIVALDARDDTEPVVLEIEADRQPDNLCIYVFALTADGLKASDTGYVNIE